MSKASRDEKDAENEPVTLQRAPISLDYDYSAGQSASRFLRGIKRGKLLGQRCPVDGRTYFPSRGSCPQHGVGFGDEVIELSDKGTVATFSIVRVPSDVIPLELPYITVNIVLDGSDTILMHVLDAKLEEVRMGMRVQAVWKPEAEWTNSTENIMYFRPIDEPDADYDSYKEHI